MTGRIPKVNWAYYVNGVEQTFWRRIYPTKTFKAVAGLTLGAAYAALKHEISWKVAGATAASGVALILVRGAMSKLELSNAALNPDLGNVVALPK